MLYYTILYYTILYYTILYYTILYYTTLHYTILYYTILYYTIIVQYMILYDIIFYYEGELASASVASGDTHRFSSPHGVVVAVSLHRGEVKGVDMYVCMYVYCNYL